MLNKENTAEIFKYESFGTHDGDGIRFCVFFRGCPLRCAYCHNADSWAGVKSETVTVDELVKKVVRFKPYFSNGGGVTFSGGEPLLFAKFIVEAENALIEKGIGSYIDTSGALPLSKDIKKAIELSETVMLDLKFADENGYQTFCKGGIDYTLETLKYLDSIGKNTWIRTVIMPEVNDSEKDIDKYFEIVKDFKCISKYELLAFHTMGFAKYDELGIENPLKGKKAMDETRKDELQAYLNSLFENYKRK